MDFGHLWTYGKLFGDPESLVLEVDSLTELATDLLGEGSVLGADAARERVFGGCRGLPRLHELVSAMIIVVWDRRCYLANY